MAVQARERSVWSVVAGSLLLLDGLVAGLASVGLGLVSMFPPVAAIEGRTSPDQTQWALSIAMFVVAIACFWAAQRAIRGIRSGRIVGVVLAVFLALQLAWVLVGTSIDMGWLVVYAVFLGVQLLIIVGLIRWPAAGTAPSGHVESGVTRA